MINLKDYKLVKINSILQKEEPLTLIDIEVKENHNFYIVSDNDELILSHNCDGDSIVSQLINFFNLWPELYDSEKIYRCLTPLLILKNKKNKKEIYIYTYDELKKWEVNNDKQLWEYDYKKGLGSLEDKEYEEMLKNPNLIKFTKDKLGDEKIKVWFGQDSELRKRELLE